MRRLTVTLLATMAAASFSAPAAHAADTCANAAYRTGAGVNLPDCRAWEQVSPTSKNGNNVLTSGTVATSTDGDRVYFNATGDLGGADSVSLSAYVARRGPAWLTAPVDPPLDSAPFVNTIPTLALSSDLTEAVVVTTRKLTSDAVEGASNVYIRNTADRSYTLAFTEPGGALAREFLGFGGSDNFFAATPDLSHIAFRSREQLTPDAAPGTSNLFEWDGGAVKLASTLPNGSAAASGASASTPAALAQHAYSDDGSRLTFAVVDDFTFQPVLYQRRNGSSTLISYSDRTGDDPSVGVSTLGYYANPAGTQVTFVGSGPLTDQSDPNTGANLYRWSASTGKPVDLLAGVVAPGVAPSVDGLQYVSPDGRYAWFTSSAALTADATGQNTQLFVLDTTAQTLRLVASFTADNETLGGGQYGFSADGSKATVRSFSRLTGYDNSNPDCDEFTTNAVDTCAEVFTYDAAQSTPALRCLSCGLQGRQPAGSANMGPGRSAFGGITARPVTDSGRVYFDTPERLSSADVNSLPDVYEYTPGVGTRLISSGQGSKPATFAQASPSGDDAFFYTGDPLVPQDGDPLLDLYTARVGGGLASQQVAPAQPNPCQGSSCQGEPPAGPTLPRPGTSSFAGVPEPPVFSVKRPSAAALRSAARTGRLALEVKVGASGRISARLRAKLGRRTSSVGSAKATATRAGTIKLTLKLSKAARRELARKRKLRLALKVAYSRRAPLSSSFTLQRSSSKGGDR